MLCRSRFLALFVLGIVARYLNGLLDGKPTFMANRREFV
jgi:hypothetical protein